MSAVFLNCFFPFILGLGIWLSLKLTDLTRLVGQKDPPFSTSPVLGLEADITAPEFCVDI